MVTPVCLCGGSGAGNAFMHGVVIRLDMPDIVGPLVDRLQVVLRVGSLSLVVGLVVGRWASRT